MTDAKVTLAHKKNLRDAEANKPKLLARIKAATGVDYTFECEPKFDDFVIGLIKGQCGFHDKIGDAFYGAEGYLEHIAILMEKAGKDDMIKEAVVDATPTKKIVINLVAEEVPDDKLIQFKDGAMQLYVTPKYFNTWKRYYSEFDLTKIL